MGTDSTIFSATQFKNIEAGLIRRTIDDRLRKLAEAANLNQLQKKMCAIHGTLLNYGSIKCSLSAGKLAEIIVFASDVEECPDKKLVICR